MQLPIVAPAPIVSAHAEAVRHLFNDVRQFEHFQNYLTGLMVLENKSLANISRCFWKVLTRRTSRFMSESPWQPQQVNRFRIQYVLAQTVAIRPVAKEGIVNLTSEKENCIDSAEVIPSGSCTPVSAFPPKSSATVSGSTTRFP